MMRFPRSMTALIALTALPLVSPAVASASHRPAGNATHPVSQAAISTDLKRETGYSASQLTSEPVCGQPQPGTMSCQAQMLEVKSTGRRFELLHKPHLKRLRWRRSRIRPVPSP